MGMYDTPDTPPSRLEYINNVPVYTANRGVSSLLDLPRKFVDSGEYFFLGIAFPPAISTFVLARDTFSGVITVPPLSYILSLSGDTYVDVPHQPDDGFGFMVRIYDKGAKMESIINAQFIRGSLIALNERPTGAEGQKGPYWLQDPFVLLKPGTLQMEITNLSQTQDKHIQMLLGLAVPANTKSVNEVIIENGLRTS